VLLLAAGVVWQLNRPSRTATPAAVATTPASAPPTSSASPSSSPSPSPSKTPTSSPAASKTSASAGLPARPAGWNLYRDKTGFSLYVPAGWTRSKEGSIVYFRKNGRVLGIDQSDHPKSDPVADWTGQAAYRVKRGDFPGYHRIRIDPVKYWRKAADWEFTYTRGGARQHVDNRGFVVSKTQAYGIYWQTTDATWQSARADLALVYASFRPAPDA
jgi:hypothetical protein